MDMEIKKLLKMKILEQNLSALLQKLDTEINQTDVQWMQLKSLVPATQQFAPPAELSKAKPTVPVFQNAKMEHHIDDESVNETQLDLSLGNINTEGDSISDEELMD